MDQSRRASGVRDWPLSAKVMAALTLTLLPPGIVAVAAAVRNYQTAVAHGASTRLSLPQAATIALPILMWLAAMGIGWLVANSLIVRPLVRMRNVVEQYRRGDKTLRLGATRYFSREVGALAEAFDALADDIDTHDAEIDAALTEQKRLTREVHHRVKNNLQIVSSLLSIQARDAAGSDVAQAYAIIQSRVSALAIVHRWMYDSDAPGGGQNVDLKALTTDLAAGLEQSLAASEPLAISITPTVERLFVGQDTAVPLAFLITELVSCAARLSVPERARRDDHGGRLRRPRHAGRRGPGVRRQRPARRPHRPPEQPHHRGHGPPTARAAGARRGSGQLFDPLPAARAAYAIVSRGRPRRRSAASA